MSITLSTLIVSCCSLAELDFRQARVWLGEVCASVADEQHEAQRAEEADWAFPQAEPQPVSHWTEKSDKSAGKALLLKHHQRAAELRS